jgi:hypothetical protein
MTLGELVVRKLMRQQIKWMQEETVALRKTAY